MTDKAKLLDSVKKNVRALLISAPMGLSMRELERDYSEVIGDRISQVALQLGYNSAQDLLLNLPDVADPLWDRGILVLFGVANCAHTAKIQKHVARQKKDKTKILKKRAAVNRKPLNTRDSLGPYSYRAPRRTQQSSFGSKPYSYSKPATVTASVPAALQIRVKLILKRYPAGISSSQFEETFFLSESYCLNFKKLGYSSLWEFLHAIPEVKASHTSKDEFDIFLVSSNVGAIPAGYEDSDDNVRSSDFVHKGRVVRSRTTATQERKPQTDREPKERPKATLPPRMGGPRMAPTNSRSPWALAGVPQPVKKAPIARGRGKLREDGSEKAGRVEEGSLRKPSRLRKPADSVPLPIEQNVDAPFEKEFIDDIRQILSKYPEGIWSIELPDEYEHLTGKPLRCFNMGYYSIVELVSAMPDVVTVIREDSSDWKLYDARTKMHDNDQGVEPSREVTEEEELSLDAVKGRLRMLLEDKNEGILLDELESAYETKYSRRLPLQQLGFKDIDSLVLLMPDAVKVVYQGRDRIWVYAQRETDGVPKYDSQMAKLCSLPQDAVGFGYKYHDHEMPPLNEYFQVYVSSVYTPHKFTVQIRDREKNQALEELMDDLEAVYKYPEGDRYSFPASMIAVNQLCCALYLEDDNWHRATITGVINNDFVEVNYVDYGSTLQVPKSCLRLLKACFLKLPAMAIDARLANIEPRGEEWSPKARDRLLELTTERVLFAQCSEYKSKVLSLYLCDTNTEDDIVIHDVLVREEFAVYSNQPTPVSTQGSAAFDPSDFINPIAELPIDVPVNVEIPVDQDTLDIPEQYTPSEPAHQVTEAGDHERQISVEEEYIEDDIAAMAKELEEIEDNESDSEDMEEIGENNLNIEDIELTMKFLVGRRRRLLAVLSSADGVDAIDDLDETEGLIRIFEEEKKKKLARSGNTGRKVSASASSPDDVPPEERSRSPEDSSSGPPELESEAPESPDDDEQHPEQPEAPAPSKMANLSDLKRQLEMAAAPQRSDGGGLLRGGELSVDGRVQQEEEEEPSTVEHPRRKPEVSAGNTDFPVLESENTEMSSLPQQPAKPVVDPETLKDLGDMLRSSLKISAEPFKPKATISPFRHPAAVPAPMPVTPSSFLDNRDAEQEDKIQGQESDQTQGLGGPYQQRVLPPQHQLTYQQMMQQMGGNPEMYGQQQMAGYGEEPYLANQMPGYLPAMGRGQPFPPSRNLRGMPGEGAYDSSMPPNIPPVQRNLRDLPLSMVGNQPIGTPGMEPGGMGSMGPGGVGSMGPASSGYQMPGSSLPPQMVQSGRDHTPQRQPRQDVQQFYSGGLDIPQIPPPRIPAAPVIRGMKVSGSSNIIRFPSQMQASNFQRPQFQQVPGQFQRPPPNLNMNNMPYPPPEGMMNNALMGGMGNNMYRGPSPMGYGMGGQMYPPRPMGRGRGNNP